MKIADHWRQDGLVSALERYHVPEQARRFVEDLALDADLRSVTVPGLDEDSRVAGRMLAHAVFTPRSLLPRSLLEGMPLGPLADVQIYTTDAHGRHAGKMHAAGQCKHAGDISEYDDLVLLDEWLPTYAELESRPWPGPFCSKCGGFSVRRLSGAQCDHLALAYEVDEYVKKLEWLEQTLSAPRDNPFASTAEALEVRVEELAELRVRAHEVCGGRPDLGEYAAGLDGRIDVLTRRLRMRLSSR